LVDYGNELRTNNGESAIMACLVNGGKGKNFVEILRYFGVNDARNIIDRAILDLNMKSHSVS
jgi:hypothetical protein